MIVCVAVTKEGLVDPRWGRADRVAVAAIGDGGVERWEEFDVEWGLLHDGAGEGQHHARVARFLQAHGVRAVVANHMGVGMEQMLGKMGIQIRLGASGRAREAVLSGLADRS